MSQKIFIFFIFVQCREIMKRFFYSRRDYLDIVDDPVHEELGRPSHHQVLLLAGDKVAVD